MREGSWGKGTGQSPDIGEGTGWENSMAAFPLLATCQGPSCSAQLLWRDGNNCPSLNSGPKS